MASTNASPFHRSFAWALALSAACGLSACGGGSNDSASQTQSTTGGPNMDGRKSYSWSFDEGSDTTQAFAANEVGVGPSAFLITACSPNAANCKVTRVAGKDGGKALQFWPSSSESFAWIKPGPGSTICSADFLPFDPYGRYDYRMTLALWFHADKLDGGATYHLFGSGDPNVATLKSSSFHLRLVDGRVQLSVYPSALAYEPDVRVTSDTTFAPGAWHHVAVTYDNMDIALFVDGKLEKTARSLEKRIKEPCNPIFVGGMPTTTISDVPSEANSFILPGAIDQIVFSNRTYTPTEILNLAGGVTAK